MIDLIMQKYDLILKMIDLIMKNYDLIMKMIDLIMKKYDLILKMIALIIKIVKSPFRCSNRLKLEDIQHGFDPNQ